MPEKSVTNYKPQPRADLPKLSDTARSIVEQIAYELVPRMVEQRIAAIKDELFAEFAKRMRAEHLAETATRPRERYR